MKHPHAEIIKALADDDSLTLWYLDHGSWFKYPQGNSYVITFVAHNKAMQFHLGPTPPPRMIETPYGSYPEPLKEAPEPGTRYWIPKADGTVSFCGEWIGIPIEINWLKAGLVHLDHHAAEQQAQVELKRRMAELGWEKS